MRAKVLKLKIMSKNKRYNGLEIKCNKTRTEFYGFTKFFYFFKHYYSTSVALPF